MTRPSSRRFISEINVVPYVDVMLVLLVIFMITAPLMSQGIIVNLPDVFWRSNRLNQNVDSWARQAPPEHPELGPPAT